MYGVLITAVTLAAFAVALPSGEAAARTAAFTTLAVAQILHLGNARSRGPVLHPSRAFANPWALASVVLALALQAIALAFGPLASVLRVTALPAHVWTAVVLLSLAPAVTGQVLKLLRRSR
jgi:P-type Ca2+ transporter type 2C